MHDSTTKIMDAMIERAETLGLAAPDRGAREHGERVLAALRDAIGAAGGAIAFDRYMEIVLYAPGLGYYSAGSHKFGSAGDFITAPELSGLFAQCVAAQAAEVLDALGGGEILEFGAGSGALAAGVIAALRARASPLRRYRILELSGELRARQRATLAEAGVDVACEVEWLDRLAADSCEGVILANEVLDAMPVHRFRITPDELHACGVGWSEHGPHYVDLSAGPEVRAAVEAVQSSLGTPLPAGYESEINLRAAPWIGQIATALRRGLVLLIDYGFGRREYYHPQRSSGTLMCHYRHRAHDDALLMPGLQDITAHVDYSAVADAAVACGLDVCGYCTQAQFLINSGLLDLAARADGEAQRYALAQQVKRLVLPSEMGERFKVMALGQAVSAPSGFNGEDWRGRL